MSTFLGVCDVPVMGIQGATVSVSAICSGYEESHLPNQVGSAKKACCDEGSN